MCIFWILKGVLLINIANRIRIVLNYSEIDRAFFYVFVLLDMLSLIKPYTETNLSVLLSSFKSMIEYPLTPTIFIAFRVANSISSLRSDENPSTLSSHKERPI